MAVTLESSIPQTGSPDPRAYAETNFRTLNGGRINLDSDEETRSSFQDELKILDALTRELKDIRWVFMGDMNFYS